MTIISSACKFCCSDHDTNSNGVEPKPTIETSCTKFFKTPTSLIAHNTLFPQILFVIQFIKTYILAYTE